jgi:hypothetical protein
LRDWEEENIWDDLWRGFIFQLDQQGLLDWQECFMDGSFAPAKKGGSASEKPRKAKEQSGWWWRTARVFLWEGPCLRIARRDQTGDSHTRRLQGTDGALSEAFDR